MFLVPFIIRDELSSLIQLKLRPITLLLDNRGKSFCKTDNPAEWCEVNGISVEKQWKEKDMVFIKVDSTKTKLSDFYSFEQLTSSQTRGTEECWRTFYVLNEKTWDGLFESTIFEALKTIQQKC